MRRAAVVFLLCLCPAPARAQEAVQLKLGGDGVKVVEVDKVITVKEKRTVVVSFPVTVSAAPLANTRYNWTVPPGVYAVPRGALLEVRSAPKGELVIDLHQETFDFKAGTLTNRYGSLTLTVGDVPPGPGPKPPEPKPPEPKPVGKLGKALIVYETADLSKMPRPQHAVLFSKTVRDYLSAKCVTEPDGKTRAWRIFDKDVDASSDTRGWADLLKRPRQSVPWVVLTDAAGAVLHEGPLPGDVEQTLALLRKWGE